MAKKSNKKFTSFEIPELSNACQTLLANIRFASVEEDIKTIVVTSTLPDEGKTTVCSNLALAIAASGKRVLLVDADLRRRCLGRLLNVHPQFGIHALLSGRASLEQTIVPTQYENLMFLDCEPNIPNPPDILASRRFASMVSTLSREFDFVIFDAPPVGVFVDAAIIGSVADGTLLVIRERKTKREDAINAVQQLRAADARILGVTMTFTRAEEKNYYYYSYYNEDGTKKKRGKKGEAAAPAPAPIAHVNVDAGPQPINMEPRTKSVGRGFGASAGAGAGASHRSYASQAAQPVQPAAQQTVRPVRTSSASRAEGAAARAAARAASRADQSQNHDA